MILNPKTRKIRRKTRKKTKTKALGDGSPQSGQTGAKAPSARARGFAEKEKRMEKHPLFQAFFYAPYRFPCMQNVKA